VPPEGSKKRDRPILAFVVDDEPDLLNLVRIFLQDYDWDIETFLSGADCLERVKRKPLPDVIILDVMMPALNGWETCKRLREDPKTQTIPIAFLTAKVRKEDYEEGLRCGGDLYIEKSPNIGRDLDRVREYLGKRGLL